MFCSSYALNPDKNKWKRRARQARLTVVIQAAWRGSRARVMVAPTLLAHIQALAETRRMREEERLAACGAALEAAGKEAERKRRSEELRDMRYGRCY